MNHYIGIVEMNEVEKRRLDEFVEKHMGCQKTPRLHAISGPGIKYDLHITENSFFTGIEIECPCCHEKEDITDINSI